MRTPAARLSLSWRYPDSVVLNCSAAEVASMASEFDRGRLEARGKADSWSSGAPEQAGNIAADSEPPLVDDGPRFMTAEEREDRRALVRQKFIAGKLITLAEFKKKYGL
jgi:hypothetical protein